MCATVKRCVMTDKELANMSAAVAVAVARAGDVTMLAARIGVAKTTIYRWLSGDTIISAETAKRCADATDMTLQDFRPDLGD